MVASIQERHHEIELIHRLAVVDNFKGPHDAFGKDPRRTIKKCKENGIRSPNALLAFINCKKVLGDQTKLVPWKLYEEMEDKRLKGKGTYGLDGRFFYYVVEKEGEKKLLETRFPRLILCCNREKVLDTVKKEAVPGTTKLHEFASVKCEIPTTKKRQIFQARISDLPCGCTNCRSRQNSQGNLPDICKYKKRRNTRLINITVDRDGTADNDDIVDDSDAMSECSDGN